MSTRPRQRRRPPRGTLTEAAELLSARRHALGLTQRQLSELAAVGERRLQELEAGGSGVRLVTLLQLADALGLVVGLLPGSSRSEIGRWGGVVLGVPEPDQ